MTIVVKKRKPPHHMPKPLHIPETNKKKKETNVAITPIVTQRQAAERSQVIGVKPIWFLQAKYWP